MTHPSSVPILCADIGNSAIKLALVAPGTGEPLACQRIPHPQLAKHPDGIHWLASDQPLTQGVVSSVSNAAQTQVWLDALTHQYGQQLVMTAVTPAHANDFGIDLAAYPPEQLGADRYVNLVTAQYATPNNDPKKDSIIIDAGTAITVDWLNGAGTYLGGVILPGPDTLTTSLQQATARLPRVSLSWPLQYPGQSTQQGIQAGLAIGLVGMLTHVLHAGPFNLNHPQTRIVMTGGHAQTIIRLFEHAESPLTPQLCHQPDWTTLGLWHSWRQQQADSLAANPTGYSSEPVAP